MSTERIIIREELGGAPAVDSSYGAQVREKIERHLREGAVVEVSFDDLDMATTSFVNEVVLVLYLNHEPSEVDSRVKFTGGDEFDRYRIERARERGIELRCNPPQEAASRNGSLIS